MGSLRGGARRVAVLLLLLPPAARWAGAQAAVASPEYVHERWTVADGLPINTVTAIVQTRDGYLWLGTNDGVVRFDGVRFAVYNAGNTPELPSNRIVALHEDRAGALWIVTEQQHLVRHRRGRFTRIGAANGLHGGVVRLSETSDGALLVTTTRGIGLLAGTRYTPLTTAGVSAQAGLGGGNAARRRDGSVWLAALREGLWRAADGHAEDVTPPALRGAVVTRVWADDRDRLWIAAESSLWIEDRGFREVRTPDGPLAYVVAVRFDERRDRAWLLGRHQVSVATDTAARVVTRAPGRDGQLWPALTLDSTGAAWYGIGPALYREDRRILTLDGAPGDNLAAGAVVSVTIDREGSVWMGTRAAGLHRIKPSVFRVVGVPEGLPDGNVYPVYEDPSGSVWIGTLGAGTSRVDGGGTRVTSFEPPQPGAANPDLYPSFPRDFLADGPDRLWVAALDGIRSCTLPAFRCERDTTALPDPLGAVHALHRDPGGRLWAGTEDGVLRRDGDRWARVPGWPLPTIQVRAFADTPDGALWMATDGGGIVRFGGGRFTRVSTADGLPSDVVRALHVDPDGWLWVGTEGRGLARVDPRAWGDAGGASARDRRIVHVGTDDGLHDDAIHRILADEAGRLWMNTNRGIFWVPRAELAAFADGRAGEVRSTAYAERDGLRHREGNGGVGSAGTRTRDGRLWFPTQDGVAIVDPRHITARRLRAPTVVERLVAGDSVVVPAGDTIRIGVRGRDLTIEYTALSLHEPANLRFRYRLDPYDADWVEVGSRRVAYYTRVPSGRYTFRVQAASPGAPFGPEEATLALRLDPRFHETRVARALLALALVVLAAGAFRWRTAALRRRARELTALVDERTTALRAHERELEARNEELGELHEARSRLFANLTHEFRTPLTLILGPLRSLLDGRHGPIAADVREQGELMQRNGQRLLRLINQVLDLSRLEACAVTLDRRPRDLVAFARGVTLAFAPMAERRGIALDLRAGPGEVRAAVDAEQLEKVLLNLLSNALKFTPRGGAVTVEVREADGAAELVVRDTGVGLAPETLPRIFDRFYQVDASATRRHEGTGIGLALAREVVALHGGTIAVESAVGVGSTFVVRLPLAATAREAAAAVPPVGTTRAGEAAAAAPPTAEVVGAFTLPEPETEPDAAGEADDEDRTTVLVVDDNADVRAYVRSVLAPTYRVLEAADGRAGLTAARAALPDLIAADVMMPGLDGLALARALKDDPMTEAIPVVLLTARAAAEDQVAGLETGADAYLVKPFDPAVLEAQVAALLARRERLRERFRQGDLAPPVSTAASEAPAAVASPLPPALERRLRPLVEAALHEPGFGPEALAAAAGLSYHRLYRALRDELRMSPSRFIRTVRVECAAELLRQGAGSVTTVAYAVGFESLSYFGRAYRERFGVPPSEHLATGSAT